MNGHLVVFGRVNELVAGCVVSHMSSLIPDLSLGMKFYLPSKPQDEKGAPKSQSS